MPENQIVAPLDLDKQKPTPGGICDPYVISHAWMLMEAKMRLAGNNTNTINQARQYYIAGVYAAAAAVLTERADYTDLTKAATLIDVAAK